MLSPQLHFFDAQVIGSPSMGQLTSFDSVLCAAESTKRFSAQIALRPDVAITPAQMELSDSFDLDLSMGLSEYEWSRTAEQLLTLEATLQIGIGNTSSLDNFIRFALYRCLSLRKNTEIEGGSHTLDLVTLYRAMALLRPNNLPFQIDPSRSGAHIRSVLFSQLPNDHGADTVREAFQLAMKHNPKMVSYAISHAEPSCLQSKMGFVDGNVESLSALKPVFVCHEHLVDSKKWGVYLAMATDPGFPNIVYAIDLQCDQTALIDADGENLERFIRSTEDQTARPIVRINLSRFPFVSHLGVLDQDAIKRLKLDTKMIQHNASLLAMQQTLCLSMLELSAGADTALSADPDFQLYGSEYHASDRQLIEELHNMPFQGWGGALDKAIDPRVKALGYRLISRFCPALLSNGDKTAWAAHCADRLIGKADAGKIEAIHKYCVGKLAATATPMGIRTAAKHWLDTYGAANGRTD